MHKLIDDLIILSIDAGKAILNIYESDFDYQIKEDASPLTEADKISHQIIYKKLTELTPDIPIISEEDSSIPFHIRSLWKKYWLIDPLDGTKEFINKNGEFTVNIALIEDNRPILGIIYIPITKETYWGSNQIGSFYTKENEEPIKMSISKGTQNYIRIMASRSHPSDALESLLEQIGRYKIINRGSSLKFCLIASGYADVYPRFGPTSEWDTAAGDAIVRFSGGHICDLENNPLLYNTKESFINPYFIVSRNKKEAENLIKKIRNIID